MNYSLAEHQSKKLIDRELSESKAIISKIDPSSIQKLNESAQGKSRKLIVKMDAIHVGRTANYTFYTAEGLKAGLTSWTTPYNKPVLTHHDQHNGEPIGRILQASYAENTQSGREGLQFTCEITDPTAIEKVLDGRYKTVSIGATTDRVTCNICGTDRTKEWCDHWRGEEYDGQTAHFIVGTTFGQEVSYVNVPADKDAGNTSVTVAEEDTAASKESVALEVFQVSEGVFQDASNPDVNLHGQLSESMKAKLEGLLGFVERSESTVPLPNNPETPETPVKEGEQPNTPETPVKENETPETPVKENETPETPVVPETPVQESDVQTKLTEAEKELTTLKGKVNEMQSTISTLVMEKQKIESKLTEQTNSNQSLVTEMATLNSKLHKQLAEQVVTLKRQLNKPDVVGKEATECIDVHIERSKESLENSLADLQEEMKAWKPVPGSVTNPGVSDLETAEGEQDKKYSVGEATDLIKGMFSPKRKK